MSVDEVPLPYSPIPQTSESPFADIEASVPKRRRRTGRHGLALWLIAMMILSVASLGVLWTSGFIQFKLPGQQETQKGDGNRPYKDVSDRKQSAETPVPNGETRGVKLRDRLPSHLTLNHDSPLIRLILEGREKMKKGQSDQAIDIWHRVIQTKGREELHLLYKTEAAQRLVCLSGSRILLPQNSLAKLTLNYDAVFASQFSEAFAFAFNELGADVAKTRFRNFTDEITDDVIDLLEYMTVHNDPLKMRIVEGNIEFLRGRYSSALHSWQSIVNDEDDTRKTKFWKAHALYRMTWLARTGVLTLGFDEFASRAGENERQAMTLWQEAGLDRDQALKQKVAVNNDMARLQETRYTRLKKNQSK